MEQALQEQCRTARVVDISVALGVSPGSVYGKLVRMGLGSIHARGDGVTPQPSRFNVIDAPEAALREQANRAMAVGPARVCQWQTWTAKGPDYYAAMRAGTPLVCGKETTTVPSWRGPVPCSYCDDHAARAFQPSPQFPRSPA